MAFGKKFDRNSVDRETSTDVSGFRIAGFPSGSTVIRLLDELDDWTEYWEHYDQNIKKYFPCSGRNNGCVGCSQDLRSSRKWLANAYVVSSDKSASVGYVNLYKFPATIINKFVRHSDRRGSLLSDDYEVIRTGQALDTEYDLERGDDAKFDFDQYQPKRVDHEAALTSAYDEYMAEFSRVVPEAPVEREIQVRAASTYQVRAPREPVAAAPAPVVRAAVAQDPPSEPQAPAAEAEEDGEVLSEDQIMNMEFADLVQLAQRAGLDVPEDFVEADQVGAWLIETLGTE